MFLQTFISEALNEPRAAVAYQVSRRLAELFPDRAIVEGDDCDFDLAEYARSGGCVLRREPNVHGQIATGWDRDRARTIDRPRQVWFEVDWQGHLLDVLLMTLDECCFANYWIVSDSDAVAREFFGAVCAHDPEVNDEILVYSSGRWQGRAALFEAVRTVGFDGLILPGTLKRDLRTDVERFFAAESIYRSLGAPWRRGILFTGPPGNGKTHTIKALIAELGKPCLYVKSLQSENWTEATCLRQVFERARRTAPCVLVLEDLDTLVTAKTRSALLNELDGFAPNDGILTLATTNHAERLDPALVDRPSRFDRKIHFGLPGHAERLAYVKHWVATLPVSAQPDGEALERIAEGTEGFSFAYLKELLLSAILVRADEESRLGSWQSRPLEDILNAQVSSLRAQMVTEMSTASTGNDPDEE